MNNRKISLGLILTAAACVLAVVGLVFYLNNTKTTYFSALGVNTTVVGCIIAAIACMVVSIIVGLKGTPVWADILPIAASVLLVAGVMSFAATRINGIAAIMTFENNAQNMADMQSAILGMIVLGVAVAVSWLAAFFDVTSEK